MLSKWGFNDGDEPDALIDWLAEHRPDIDYAELDFHPVLCALVRRYLLPVLDQRVEVVEIETTHNPIRATAVEGVPVPEAVWYGRAPEPTLTPESVEVPYDVVVQVIDELREAPGG